MNRDSRSLLRLQVSFQKLADIQEVRLLRQVARRHDIEAVIQGLRKALGNPVSNGLPVIVPALRRIAKLEQELKEVSREIELLRNDMISARSRSQSAGDMSAALLMAEERKRQEMDILESISVKSGSSPPQGRND